VSPLVLSLLTFLAVVLAIGGAYSVVSDLFLRDRSRVGKRVDEEFRRRERARRATLFKDLGALAAEAALDDSAPPWRQRLAIMLEQSGLSLTPRRFLGFTGALALGLGALGLLLSKNPLGAVVGAPVGAALPLLYVHVKRKARLAKLVSQLPDAFELMARIVRAGQTMSQALQAVADEFEQPIAGEFAYCFEQQNLGLAPDTALRDLARRTGLLEIKIFVLALLVQQQTGGNLAELLDKLSEVIRERFRIRGKITALTAEGRFQALVLLILPVALLGAITVVNRAYADVLFEHYGLLIGMFVFEVIGALWIRKIVNFDF
jgi:tight adherence protein B